MCAPATVCPEPGTTETSQMAVKSSLNSLMYTNASASAHPQLPLFFSHQSKSGKLSSLLSIWMLPFVLDSLTSGTAELNSAFTNLQKSISFFYRKGSKDTSYESGLIHFCRFRSDPCSFAECTAPSSFTLWPSGYYLLEFTGEKGGEEGKRKKRRRTRRNIHAQW